VYLHTHSFVRVGLRVSQKALSLPGCKSIPILYCGCVLQANQCRLCRGSFAVCLLQIDFAFLRAASLEQTIIGQLDQWVVEAL